MYALRIDSTEAAFNLALEETLFDTLSPENPGIFLIWRNAPSVIVGCHQNTAEEVDAAYCRERRWEHRIVQLPVAEILREKQFENSPCVLCSRLRPGGKPRSVRKQPGKQGALTAPPAAGQD